MTDWNEQRVLVTGGAGFIGSHLVRKLVERGAKVDVLQRLDSDIGRLDPVSTNVTIHRCVLSDRHAVGAIIRDIAPDFVFHLASESRLNHTKSTVACLRSLEDTVRPLICLVDALASLKQPPKAFVRAGTLAECGAGPEPVTEFALEQPLTAYGVAMLAATKYLSALAPDLPFASITARLALTYGQGQSDRFLIPQLVAAIASRDKIELSRPSDRRDLVHVEDVTDALICFASSEAIARHDVINVCSGVAPSMREVADMIADLGNADRAIFPTATGADNHEPNTLFMDGTLARNAFGWEAKIHLRDGLAEMIQKAVTCGELREVASVG